ncbi:uncharacterized protein DUF4214 [Roseibium hamelinense]|uniref:Uncharacterized protein DUF4214 n=1 Tax=Roseibium hamelinense TaxID=150831 RepID=A0A562T7P7_9HYPH|nr:DUF4214 domain-containing protein [Roseibium hamelinense]MTI43571.1 DUF4214 domain-containing protein [Roseibium hamelinense]TWI89635.1 uncharacterized protein DUF4214 [Roseibium hamelinense]
MTTSAAITRYYEHILQRAPTADELSAAVSSVDGGTQSLTQIRDSLATSSEAVTFIDQIIRIYQAAFNRLPDITGMQGAGGDGGWPDQLRADPTTLFTIAAGFTNSQEFLNIYGSNTVSTNFLNALYSNVLGRTPSAEEIAAWFATGQSASEILIGFSNSAEFQNNTASEVLALKQASGDAADQSSVYNGTDPLISSGSTFTLTTATDTFTGTSSDDTFSGVFENGGTTTINSADTLDGAGGTGDALNIRAIDNASGGSTVAPQVSNTENFYITNQDATSNDFFALDFTSTTGEVAVWSKSSVAGSVTRALNVDATTAGLDSTQGTLAVNFSGARTGTSDAFSLNVIGSGTSTAAAVFQTITSSASDDSTFEVANITTSTSDSFVQLGTGSMSLTTVNVSGSNKLTMTETSSTLSTVSASGMTGGGVDITATSSTATGFSFTGSGSDDRILLTNTTLNNASSLNGGNGSDTLASTSFSVTASVINSATNFTTLESTSGGNLTASDFTGINRFLFSGDGSTGRSSISGVETSDSFVFSADQSQTDEALRFTGQNAGTTLTFELQAQSGTDGQVEVFANTNSGNDNAAVGFGGNISSVVINSTVSGTQTNANAIYAVDNNYNHYAFDNQGGPSNFTITGDHALTITALAGVSMSSSTDTIGFESAVNVNAADLSGVLRIAGSNSADVIAGGGAADIIYGLGGDDTLTGNGGADQFRFVGFNATDRITDFSNGEDKVGSNVIDFGNTTATTAGATLNAADYVDNRAAITAIGSADGNKVIELQGASSTTQVQTDTGAAVEAYVLVFNSTTGRGELWYDSDWSNTGRTQVATFDTITDLAGVTGFSNTDFVEFVA